MKLFGRARDDRLIHGIRLKIRGGAESLPAPLVGAYVTAFSIAADPQSAASRSVGAIRQMGYEFDDILPEGLSMPIGDWGAFIDSAWPEFREHFPTQAQISARLANGGVVFSPFAGFEAD